MTKSKTGGIPPYLKKTAIAALAVFAVIFWVLFVPHRLGHTPTLVSIDRGMPAGKVAELLKKDGIIGDVFSFKLTRSLRKAKFKAGDYELSPSMNNWKIISMLASGKVKQYKITVPEGYSTKQIARLLAAQHVTSDTAFLKKCADAELVRRKKLEGNTFEGYLFPETYLFNVNMKEEEIIGMMYANFKAVMEKNGVYKKCEAKKPGFYDVLKLASIVEKEAEKPSERALIAGVFTNRLKARMRLESCATVSFALGDRVKGKTRLSLNDLEVESRYNTYKYYGLPPAPICNPGLPSILAALNPAETKFMFFVSKGDGTHEFSETLEQHNAAKAKFEK